MLVIRGSPVITRCAALLVEVKADHLKARLDFGKAFRLLLECPAQNALTAVLIRQIHSQHTLQACTISSS